ncbi:DegT/DnrJ/EryC1/StrS aminotransferase family protein [Roseiflexus sp.]|uniref:DegT/DnrJ/EryC1/StrS family aminotransferase n=1 Tax=Roseiflexus sp. TaxID=2562120 RepID=UPI0021DEA836|nr:DegT/DnrJ/EryC1/StrS family aminotransferase [Roseiflexus sp.]GIV99537.1 MAG: erythromycin biosynthesis sensory transduction protein EryC1 [Roseiflexus sp.]
MPLNIPFGDLKRQHDAIRADLDIAIARVLDSGWYILGPSVSAFEEAFAAFCNARFCVGVANGTEALQLALTALGVGPGDEVITVANASVYQAITIVAVGARPVFVDVDERSHTMDPAALEAAITPHTRAIMPVHLYGRMADMDAIMMIADRYGIPVIEDCAQAHGATWRGRPAGSIGALGCFSFYPTKNLGAVGDGGAVTTNDAALAEKIRRLRQYGWERKYYTRDAGGLNSRLDELQAAILSVKLRHLPARNARRRAIAAMYNDLLADAGLILPEAPPEGDHVFHLYVIRAAERDVVQARLREQGIGTDIHYPLPTHRQPVYAPFAPREGLPTTERLAREILSLPMFPELTDDEVHAVAETVREVVRTENREPRTENREPRTKN